LCFPFAAESPSLRLDTLSAYWKAFSVLNLVSLFRADERPIRQRVQDVRSTVHRFPMVSRCANALQEDRSVSELCADEKRMPDLSPRLGVRWEIILSSLIYSAHSVCSRVHECPRFFLKPNFSVPGKSRKISLVLVVVTLYHRVPCVNKLNWTVSSQLLLVMNFPQCITQKLIAVFRYNFNAAGHRVGPGKTFWCVLEKSWNFLSINVCELCEFCMFDC